MDVVVRLALAGVVICAIGGTILCVLLAPFWLWRHL
jgi:hypothetical protein